MSGYQDIKYPLSTKSGKPMGIEEYARIAYGEWWQFVDMEQAKRAHAANVEACQKAVEEFQAGGPIKILAVHGSSRSNSSLTCAHEMSNSQLLLQKGLEVIRNYGDIEVEEVNLRDYAVNPCNNCYASTSALCGWPCNCWPFDPMQKLYPKVLRADVLLMSTGVNQSAMSSRLKLFADRLISCDGGYYIPPEEFEMKTSEYRSRKIAQSLIESITYDQRLQRKVCAFFIASKDENDTGDVDDHGEPVQSYVKMVADSLYRGFHDYGCDFGSPWYAYFAANPFEEMSLDKARLNEDKDAQDMSKMVVEAAVKRSLMIRRNPPEPRVHPVNRT